MSETVEQLAMRVRDVLGNSGSGLYERQVLEAAFSELAKHQAPAAEAFIGRGGVSIRYCLDGELVRLAEDGAHIPRLPLYTHPAIPKPAAVPDEIRALADRCCESYGDAHNNMTIYKLASFIRSLSAAPVPQSQEAKDAEQEKLSRYDRECLRIGQEIQRAAGELPIGYNIEIDVENGAGTVSLIDDEGNRTDIDTDEYLSGAISDAIDAAMSASNAAVDNEKGSSI